MRVRAAIQCDLHCLGACLVADYTVTVVDLAHKNAIETTFHCIMQLHVL